MKKFCGGILAVAVVIGLTSCAGMSSSDTQSQSPTINPNVAACDSFEAITERVRNERTDMVGDKIVAEFDKAALASSGDIKSRIEQLISALPDPIAMIYLDFDPSSKNYDDNVASVVRACNAEGAAISAFNLDLDRF